MSCASCASPLPDGARFCPSCGLPVDGERPVVSFGHVEKRVFGIPSPLVVLLLAAAAFGGAIAAFAFGRWVLGALLLVAAAVGFALLAGLARRRPEIRLAGASSRAAHTLRAYMSFATGSARAWSAANREVFSLRREIRRLSAERAEAVFALGMAALDDDKAATSEFRERVRGLESAIEDKATEAERSVLRARRRLWREREVVQPTERLPVDALELDSN